MVGRRRTAEIGASAMLRRSGGEDSRQSARVLQAHFAGTDNAIMCGRYELHTFPVALALVFGLKYPLR